MEPIDSFITAASPKSYDGSDLTPSQYSDAFANQPTDLTEDAFTPFESVDDLQEDRSIIKDIDLASLGHATQDVNESANSLSKKLFACEICGRSFQRIDHLARHKVNHDSVKPFNCIVCHRAFARKDVYRKHLQRHEADRRTRKTPHGNNCNAQLIPAIPQQAALGLLTTRQM